MYVPRPSPRPELPELQDLTSYVDLELRALSRDLQVNEKLNFVELHVEPEKPRDGLVVFADGTDWNPGSGRGIYIYYAAAWNTIGGGGPLGNRTITGTAGEIDVADGDGVAGDPVLSIAAALDLGGNTSVEIPNGTGPTVDAAGEVAVDTDTDNSNITHGSPIFHDGTSVRYVPSVAAVPSTDGHVLTYNGTNKRFEFAAVTTSDAVAASQADMEAAASNAVFANPLTQHFHPSAPKCWAYVTVSAGTPTLQTSFNITSITDTATGRLTVTIATDFSSANWCSLVSYENTTANADVSNTAVGEIGVGAATKAAGSVILESHEGGTGATTGNLVDPTAWNFAGFGDLV